MCLAGQSGPALEWLQRMSEEEWLSGSYPHAMLEFLAGRASPRKLRLLACCCCREPSVARLLNRTDAIVSAAERFAEGTGTREELLVAARGTPKPRVSGGSWSSWNSVRLPLLGQAQAAVFCLTADDAWQAASGVLRTATNLLGTTPCDRMRDIFGNPFREITVAPGWRTTEVVRMADEIDTTGGFDHVPELGETLQRAGCDDERLLSHCLNNAVHVRGCWAVDLLTGKC